LQGKKKRSSHQHIASKQKKKKKKNGKTRKHAKEKIKTLTLRSGQLGGGKSKGGTTELLYARAPREKRGGTRSRICQSEVLNQKKHRVCKKKTGGAPSKGKGRSPKPIVSRREKIPKV